MWLGMVVRVTPKDARDGGIRVCQRGQNGGGGGVQGSASIIGGEAGR